MQSTLVTRSGRAPSQRYDELMPFITLLRKRGVTAYLEIGSRHGDTFFEVMKSLPVGSIGIAVDLPGGAWGVESSKASLDAAIAELQVLGYRAAAVYGDSTTQRVFLEAASIYEHAMGSPMQFDAILIDGDHRYDGVLADWREWGGLAKIVAFHDIAGEGQVQRTSKDPVEVPRLWSELKQDYDTVEFIGDGSKMGIGVILK